MEHRAVAVVGLGTMGAGITEVFARAGLSVVAIEADPAALSRGITILEVLRTEFGGSRYAPGPLLRRLVDAGHLGRKSGRRSYHAAAPGTVPPASAIISNEDPAVRAVVALISPGASRSAAAADPVAAEIDSPAGEVLRVALASGRPADVTGRHRTGPDVRLAELVPTTLTKPAAVAAGRALAAALRLTVVQAPDRPGLLAGTLLYPYLADAARMVQDRYPADIDATMTLGCGYPRGPLELLDEIGAGAAPAVLTARYQAYGDPAFAPPPLLAAYAAAGLGLRG